MTNTFPKPEHLCGEKAIEKLYASGNAFISYPFRVVYLDVSGSDEKVPVRVLITVSKKKFKKAVHRNRVKRLTRETYRLNKSGLTALAETDNANLHVAFQYISDEIGTFNEINRKMQKTLDKLIKILSENTNRTDENG